MMPSVIRDHRAALGATNLRQRALRCAHRLIETRCAAELNLRELAAELGTGVASLYYHFANKDALLAELAIDGFHGLQRAIENAVRAPGHKTRFHACAGAYLRFTREQPRLYALMYDERILAGHPGARHAEQAAFV